MGICVMKPDAKATEQEIAEYVNGKRKILIELEKRNWQFKLFSDRVSDRKKLRAGIKFVEAIPLTPSGKLRRRDVRDWVLTGQI